MGKPGLCLVGTLSGANTGMVPTQAEFLAGSFSEAGYPTISVSRHLNPLKRLMDILFTLWRKRQVVNVQILQVYSGRNFLIADLSSALGKWLGQKVVMVIRGGDMPNFSLRNLAWTKRVFLRADKIIAPSTYMQRELAHLSKDIQVIPNVLDISLYPYRPRSDLKPCILWMRAFHPIYNPELALDTLAILRKKFPEIKLTMAGANLGLQASIEEKARAMGLLECVEFPGFLDMPAKINMAQAHDIYLHTNRIDNMPVSVLEMAAMGLPIVATNVGGVTDLLTDLQNGLIVPGENPIAMSEAIESLLTNPKITNHLSKNGRVLAESCSWSHVRPRWEELLSTL